MRYFLFSILLCSGTSLNAYTDLESARRAYAVVPFSEVYATKNQRMLMAAAIQNYWTDLDQRLPRLSPEELKWIQSELNTGDQVRLNRAISTKEYSLYNLGKLTDQCNEAAKELNNAIKNVDQSEIEMFYWTKIAGCYQESSSSISADLNRAMIDTTKDVSKGHMLDNLMLSKILRVIIPSSMADTMGWTLSLD